MEEERSQRGWLLKTITITTFIPNSVTTSRDCHLSYIKDIAVSLFLWLIKVDSFLAFWKALLR